MLVGYSRHRHSVIASRTLSWLYSITVSTFFAALVACSGEDSPESTDATGSTVTHDGQAGRTPTEAVAAPEDCQVGQAMFETGYQNFPGKQCAEIAGLIDSTYTTRIGYRKQCQELTGAASRPKSVARVQLNECGALRDQDGSYASMRVCCAAPSLAVAPKVTTYEVRLSCPDDRVQALATDLHYPAKNCGQAVTHAESSLEISAYQRACGAATPGAQNRQTILDAAVFTCREDAGAVVDVAICCSAAAPPGQAKRSIEVPTDLWETLRTGDLLGLELMLSRHPGRAHERGPQDVTPLHRAVNLAIANVLLAKDVDIEARDAYGSTSLHYAVRGRLLEVAERLLDAGANVDAANDYGDTPLSFAASEQMAGLLLERNANPNGVGSSAGPLHSAAFYGRTGVARLLMAQGADMNRTDGNGETPLHRAAFRQKAGMVRLLLENGASVNVLSTSGRPRTALDMTDNPEIIALIRSYGGRPGSE